jgi:hypothetical protein
MVMLMMIGGVGGRMSFNNTVLILQHVLQKVKLPYNILSRVPNPLTSCGI